MSFSLRGISALSGLTGQSAPLVLIISRRVIDDEAAGLVVDEDSNVQTDESGHLAGTLFNFGFYGLSFCFGGIACVVHATMGHRVVKNIHDLPSTFKINFFWCYPRSIYIIPQKSLKVKICKALIRI